MTKQYWKFFVEAIAALSAAATLATVLFDLESIKQHCWLGIIGGVLVLIGSFGYAFWQIKSKKTISLTLSSEQKVTITEDDLFQYKGIICIPVNEYFDTHVGDGVVDENSIHGMFINKCYGNRIHELEEKIQKALSNNDFTDCKRRLDYCPTRKFPLGTCIDVCDKDNIYVLFALTHFDEKDVANVSREEYTKVVRNLLTHLSSIAESKAVFMPLFGIGLSRLQRSPQRILLHLMDAMDFFNNWTVPSGISVCIKSLQSTKINLNIVEDILKKGIAEKE